MSAEPQSKKSKMSTTLDQLKQITTIVADTGDFEGIYLSEVILKGNRFPVAVHFFLSSRYNSGQIKSI